MIERDLAESSSATPALGLTSRAFETSPRKSRHGLSLQRVKATRYHVPTLSMQWRSTKFLESAWVEKFRSPLSGRTRAKLLSPLRHSFTSAHIEGPSRCVCDDLRPMRSLKLRSAPDHD